MIPAETIVPTPTLDPATVPVPAAAAPTGAVAAEPAPQPLAAPVNPFDPAYIQSRVDSFLNRKPAENPVDPAVAAAPEAPAAPVADPAPVAAPVGGEPAANEPANVEPVATDRVAAPAAEPDPELIVALPPRNVGGEPLTIVAGDKATADRLRMTIKNGLRGDEYKAKVEAVEARELAVRETEVLATTDPLGLIERAPADVQLFAARQLLAANFEALRPDIEAWWQDETRRQLALANGVNERSTARGNFESARSVQQQVQAIARTVVGLIPDTATGTPDAEEFYADALSFLARVSDTKKFTTQEIPQLLAGRLRRFGFAPADASPAPAAAATAASASAPVPPASVPAANAAAAAAASGTPTASQQPASVQRLHQVNQQRAAARAAVPLGAGASPASLPKPPKGLNIEQTADWLMQHQRARSA